MTDRVLVTGFEPFGAYPLNPSAEIAQALGGSEIDGRTVVGRILPVDFARHRGLIAELLHEVSPALYVGFGLYAGEDMVRIERTGINVADFSLPDNAGAWLTDRKIEPHGPVARSSTLPCSALRATLLEAGIPARISDSAGTYLCNAALYTALGLCAAQPKQPRCGFIHLPYATAHVAAMLRGAEGKPGLAADATAPSLAIETMIAAARIVIGKSLAAESAGDVP